MLTFLRSYIPFFSGSYPFVRVSAMDQPKTSAYPELLLNPDDEVFGFKVRDIPNLTDDDLTVAAIKRREPISERDMFLLCRYGFRSKPAQLETTASMKAIFNRLSMSKIHKLVT